MLPDNSETSPLCYYRLPGETTIYRVASERVYSFSHFREVPYNAFIAHQFKNAGFYFLSQRTVVEPGKPVYVPALPPLSEEEGRGLKKADYLAVIGKALEDIHTGALEKVVLSRYRFVQKNKIDAPGLFQALCSRYPQAYICLLHTGSECWICATPETLVHRQGLLLKTISLAGTLKDAGQIFTDKEKREQELVTRFICQQLEPVAKNLRLSGPHELEAGHIRHLVTEINAELKDSGLFSRLMDHLSPTPAVCGLPREQALAFIHENEGYNRGFYAGYLGYHEEEESRFFVNLRCARLYAQGAELFAGGGIVAGSDPESEWQETEEKMRIVGDLL